MSKFWSKNHDIYLAFNGHIYSNIIDCIFVFIGAVFVAPRSEELGIAT